jgi:hypothetical protein
MCYIHLTALIFAEIVERTLTYNVAEKCPESCPKVGLTFVQIETRVNGKMLLNKYVLIYPFIGGNTSLSVYSSITHNNKLELYDHTLPVTMEFYRFMYREIMYGGRRHQGNVLIGRILDDHSWTVCDGDQLINISYTFTNNTIIKFDDWFNQAEFNASDYIISITNPDACMVQFPVRPFQFVIQPNGTNYLAKRPVMYDNPVTQTDSLVTRTKTVRRNTKSV